MTVAASTFTASTTVPDELALGINQAWVDAPGNDMGGIAFLKTVLSQFQDGLDLALIAGSDGSGVDVTLYSTTSGGYWVWDASDNQLEAVESKLTMTTATETADNPGRQVYLQRTHTGALDESVAGAGLTGVEVRSTFNGTANCTSAEVKGGEFKARHTAANTFNVGTFKGVVGNCDSKSGAKTITSAWAVEGQIDCGTGSTITTAAGCRVAYNEDGTVTNAYGIYVDGTSVWDIGVYCVGGKSVNAIQVGENGVSGGDVLLYSATSGSSVLWDQSEDSLIVTMGSARAITGTDLALSVVMGGTLSSADSMVGLNVAVTTGGTGGTWASGIYASITQGATKNVNGYFCAAELELINSATPVSHGSVLVLNANNSGAPFEFGAFIDCRDYGSQETPLFLWAPDLDASTHGAGGDEKIWSTVASDSPCTHKLAIRVAATDYWIMCTSEKPSQA